MTCCTEPLIVFAGAISAVSAIMGAIQKDPVMFLVGLAGLIGIIIGYFYYININNAKK